MDEREAIRRLKEGDADGLRSLVEAHYDRAARAAYLVVRDPGLAEDVTQDAFVRAYDKIHLFDAARPFGPWFMRLVVNEAVEAARKRERRRTVPLDPDGVENLIAHLEDATQGPHELAEEAEDRRRVWAALAKLPPAQRAVIVQRYYLDMTEAEMSGASPPGTVKWRLHAARKRLSKLLRPNNPPANDQRRPSTAVVQGGNRD